MLNSLRFWREHGWIETVSADHAAQSQVGKRFSAFPGIAPRRLSWFTAGELAAVSPTRERHLALPKIALKARGEKGVFDPGNVEIILPIAHAPLPVLRCSAHYFSAHRHLPYGDNEFFYKVARRHEVFLGNAGKMAFGVVL
jgi:hypothetical protein